MIGSGVRVVCAITVRAPILHISRACREGQTGSASLPLDAGRSAAARRTTRSHTVADRTCPGSEFQVAHPCRRSVPRDTHAPTPPLSAADVNEAHYLRAFNSSTNAPAVVPTHHLHGRSAPPNLPGLLPHHHRPQRLRHWRLPQPVPVRRHHRAAGPCRPSVPPPPQGDHDKIASGGHPPQPLRHPATVNVANTPWRSLPRGRPRGRGPVRPAAHRAARTSSPTPRRERPLACVRARRTTPRQTRSVRARAACRPRSALPPASPHRDRTVVAPSGSGSGRSSRTAESGRGVRAAPARVGRCEASPEERDAMLLRRRVPAVEAHRLSFRRPLEVVGGGRLVGGAASRMTASISSRTPSGTPSPRGQGSSTRTPPPSRSARAFHAAIGRRRTPSGETGDHIRGDLQVAHRHPRRH